MQKLEYRVIALAPPSARKQSLSADVQTFEAQLNAQAADGWEFLRVDTIRTVTKRFMRAPEIEQVELLIFVRQVGGAPRMREQKPLSQFYSAREENRGEDAGEGVRARQEDSEPFLLPDERPAAETPKAEEPAHKALAGRPRIESAVARARDKGGEKDGKGSGDDKPAADRKFTLRAIR